MPDYVYAARDPQGGLQTGTFEAVSEDDVIAMLQHRGLIVTSVTAWETAQSGAKAAARRRMARRMHNRVSTDDQVMLCQQLATLIEAGVPLLRSLEVVSGQVESRKMLKAIEDVRHDVEGGSTFRDALARHPAVFTTLWLNLVETGEASGHLAESMQQLARHFEAAQHLQNEAKTAMTYPLFLVGMAAVVMALFAYWLIPKFETIFEQMGLELPLITQIVVGLSRAARQYFVLIILGFFGIGYVIRRYFQTENGQWMLDQALLKIPLFSTLFMYIQLAEFSRGLSTLLESGVPLLSSLQILENSATNRVYRRAIGGIKEQVREGRSMAQPMDECGMFPPIAVQMVQIGEEVGELARMAGRIAKHYEERVDTFIARMTRLFEPIAIVVMGGMVLIIVLSIFLPIFKLATGAQAPQ